MRISERFRNVLLAVGMLLLVVILISIPELGPPIIAIILGLTMIVAGIRYLIDYFSKFRYTVGGKSRFYTGVISLDIGLLLGSAFNGSTIIILFYLLGMRVVTGVITLLRALEAKKNNGQWKFAMFTAVFNFVIVVAGVIFMRNPTTVVYVYCIGLVVSAINLILQALRKTAIETIA